MAVIKTLANTKLSVTLKDVNDESLGTQSIATCNPSGTLDNFLEAGNAIIALTGATTGEVKKVSNYVLAQ